MRMADIIAQHAAYSTWDEFLGDWSYAGHKGYVGCDGCDWQQELVDAPATDSATHVAVELMKEGYGLLPLPFRER